MLLPRIACASQDIQIGPDGSTDEPQLDELPISVSSSAPSFAFLSALASVTLAHLNNFTHREIDHF
jgi:hypothetical protein